MMHISEMGSGGMIGSGIRKLLGENTHTDTRHTDSEVVLYA
jgi:hypothetical protein